MSDTEVFEIREEIPLVRIQRSTVRSATLAKGMMSERIVAEILFGALLLIVGGTFLPHVAKWSYEGGSVADAIWLLAILAPLGGYMLIHAFRSGTMLVLTLDKGVRKIAFEKETEAGPLRDFIAQVAQEQEFLIDIPTSLGLG